MYFFYPTFFIIFFHSRYVPRLLYPCTCINGHDWAEENANLVPIKQQCYNILNLEGKKIQVFSSTVAIFWEKGRFLDFCSHPRAQLKNLLYF